MANFLDKFKIRTAWEGRSHTKDLSCEHVTTSSFMRLQPVYYHNFVPKEKLSVDFRAFSRMASMPVPTFGRANLNIRAFFVPYRVIFPAWNDFITDAVHHFHDANEIPSTVPYFTNDSLVTLYRQGGIATEITDASVTADFVITQENQSPTRWKFTAHGRHIFKVMESLGYKCCFHQGETSRFSALPLLAYAKIYADWYYPSAYVGSPVWLNISKHFTDNVSQKELDTTQLRELLDFSFAVNYDSDYFVSAFDEPVGPNVGTASSFQILDPASTDGALVSSYNEVDNYTANTPYAQNPAGGLLSQYAIEALHRLTDYMARHRLAGARSLDRYLARFGVHLSAEKLNRSVYLGSHKIPMMTGDVMSTSDTMGSDGAHIGDYAGKGFLVGDDGHFEFQSDEYGLFLICASIVPEIGYYQGIDRHVLNTTRLSFFTPEFDGMGTRAISKNEAYLSLGGSPADVRNMSEIFGYTPQYSEYKCGRDWLTGDYRILSLNQSGDTAQAWHLFRDLSSKPSPVHSQSFVSGFDDRNQFNRIFNNTADTADHFYLHYFFGVKSTAKMLPLYDEYDFHNDEGSDRVLDVSGVKMN